MDLTPKYKSEKFQCPHCEVASQQQWFDVDSASNAANSILEHVFFDCKTHIRDYQQNAIAGFIVEVENANNMHMRKLGATGFSLLLAQHVKK